MTTISRRDFLNLIRNGFLSISGMLALGGLLRFLSYEANSAPKTKFDLGSAKNYPLGSHTSIPEVPALLIHTEQGFTALSLTCTHLGCTLESKEDGFACPCHGSQFDAEGNVTHGPALKRLTVLRVEQIEGDNLVLFLDE